MDGFFFFVSKSATELNGIFLLSVLIYRESALGVLYWKNDGILFAVCHILRSRAESCFCGAAETHCGSPVRMTGVVSKASIGSSDRVVMEHKQL